MMCLRLAPSARRMPISFVRSVTVASMTVHDADAPPISAKLASPPDEVEHPLLRLGRAQNLDRRFHLISRPLGMKLGHQVLSNRGDRLHVINRPTCSHTSESR